jgi:hypothetical protein
MARVAAYQRIWMLLPPLGYLEVELMAPQLWKIGRELARFGRQILEFPEDMRNLLFATRHYDQVAARQICRFEGGLPSSGRVAIFLIFPGAGLLPSHLHTLAYLRAKGYAALVVSNLPLATPDRERLLAECWYYIERPNFGYDFGGYRDGVLSLADRLPYLDRLVLLNDSTWFPLPGSRDWFDDVEALGVDFAGAASNFGTPRPEIEEFRAIDWHYRTSHRNFHYCSFALCLRPKVLRDPAFLDFWRRLRLSDKKKRTVRRGEIGFSQWALRHGFSTAATLDVTTLDRDLATIPEPRLREIARDLIIPEQPKLQAFWRQISRDPESLRSDLEKLILLAVSRQGSSYALAAYSMKERGFPFLKKSPLLLSTDSATISLKLLAKLEGAEDIIAEARQLAQRRVRDSA